MENNACCESLLVSKFRETVSQLKDPRMKTEGNFDVAFTTGFLAFDFLNGIVIHVSDASKNINYAYNSVGLIDGSANTFIGRSGCGKSTLVLQIAANIIRPYPNGAIYHDDIEGGMAGARIENLTRFSSEELSGKYIYRNSGITAENFYQRIKIIHDLKLNNPKDFEYDTGLLDPSGKRIFKMQPTVYIMDSIPVLLPDKISEEEELSGQMSTTGSAKVTSRIFRQIIPLLKSANIILLVINHIMDDVQIGPFSKPAQIAGLKPGERLPGGKTALYLANNLFRMDDGEKLIQGKDFNIDGSVVKLTIVKSRTNKIRRSIPLVFNFDIGGFDYDLSLYLLLKENKYVTSKGAYFYVGNCGVKFLQKDFKETLYQNSELQQEFSKCCYELLCSFLSDQTYRVDLNNNIDINSMILNQGLSASA